MSFWAVGQVAVTFGSRGGYPCWGRTDGIWLAEANRQAVDLVKLRIAVGDPSEE
jgi:hypothetical protein